jgi:hypothetical protein
LGSSHKQKIGKISINHSPRYLKVVPKDNGTMPHMHMLHKKIFLHYITKLKKMEYTSLIEGISVMDSVPNHNNTLNT